jgi:RNA polymerase sigma-70 factor, ECF subfamily
MSRLRVELSDQELVQQCRAGQIWAFQQLVARYYQKVYMVILGLVHNREDALDVAQETFFRAYRKIKSFQGDSSFYTWLYRIAINTAKNYLVAAGRRPAPPRVTQDQGLSVSPRARSSRCRP